MRRFGEVRKAGMKRNEYDPGFEPPEVIARPHCPNCSKRLQPMVHEKRHWDAGTGTTTIVSRRWVIDTYKGYGSFCSLKCCERFANAAHRAGYHIKT